MKVKEITVYAIGDSGDVKTWSNVPYFFTKSLVAKGIKINRVNLEENKVLKAIYKYSWYLLIKIIYPNSTHNYFRSKLNLFLSGLKIRKSLRSFPNADLQFFLTYSFSSKPYSTRPCAHFGDWTYLYLINNLNRRKAYWFETYALKTEEQNIAKTDLVLSLFPKSSEFINLNFENAKSHYLGNVVNSELPVYTEKLKAQKTISKQFLFIGGKKYSTAAKLLLDAFSKLRKEHGLAELHFVGLNAVDIGVKPLPGVQFHGYLDKNQETHKNLYYKLLFSARAIVNTQSGWAAFSALTEAMYYHTPVICKPFEEFAETYGQANDFGIYIYEDSTDELKTALLNILNSKEADYLKMMDNAHKKTKSFTWENYSTKFLDLVTKINCPANK